MGGRRIQKRILTPEEPPCNIFFKASSCPVALKSILNISELFILHAESDGAIYFDIAEEIKSFFMNFDPKHDSSTQY